MLKLAANLDWLFTEFPMPQRFHAAREAGFQGVEGLFLWQHPLDSLCDLQQITALPVVLMNAPAGDWQGGERGLASLPRREEEFIQTLHIARQYALALGCRQVHVMAGNRSPWISYDQQFDLLIARLQQACDFLADADITVLVEPLNPQDMPGYFINSFPLASEIIQRVARENIGLQFDIYHCQKIHGNITQNIEQYFPLIKHFQIASVPGRNEPGTGELNDDWILNHISSMQYQGWIGCEYKPQHATTAPVKWLIPYL
jgi:hydroxypyruvate isomerase